MLVQDDNPKISSPPVYQGSFRVDQYNIEPVRLDVETDRNVFYRGEEITGKIKASFYYGAPIVERELRYRLANGPWQTAKTDKEGQIEFKFATREFRETQTLPLVVSFPERSLNLIHNFFLAAQGFALKIDTVRPVYLSGESFETTIRAVDAEGKPTERKVTLKVIEQTLVDGKRGERLVASHDLATDDKEGVVRKTLSLEEGGTYILRAEGPDQFGNTVSASRRILLSDDNDKVRLRILADRHSYKVGDKAEVTLHWREQPALALVTFQGARVLDYKLVELKTGANKLTLPLGAKLAPNFELAVAVMVDARAEDKAGDDTEGDEVDCQLLRLHTASSPFSVTRKLNVKLAVKRKAGEGEPRPGDEVEVTVTTTDPQGRPVAGGSQPGDDRTVAVGLVRRFAGRDRHLLLRRPPRDRRSHHFEYHVRLQPVDRADQPADCWRKWIARRWLRWSRGGWRS